jgi:RNA polymerase sigma-70 factor (ECF subfamily)
MPPDSPPPEDEAILAAVRALQNGAGRDIFEVIFRRYYRPFFTFFSNQSSLSEEADDLTQATLLRAFENIDQYRREASFEAWLWQIGVNVWKNAVRDRLAAKRLALAQAQELTADVEGEVSPSLLLGDEPLDPEQAALAKERTRVLQEAIERLPPGMRWCTELRVFGDLKDREISDVTGIGLNSVRSQLFEARKRLRPILEEYFQGAEL